MTPIFTPGRPGPTPGIAPHTPVPRETGDAPATPSAFNRRYGRRRREVRADGGLSARASAYSDAELDLIRRAVAANVPASAIAAHLGSTPPAIRMLARRHGWRWPTLPRATMADVMEERT